jgi:hypothetical protein
MRFRECAALGASRDRRAVPSKFQNLGGAGKKSLARVDRRTGAAGVVRVFPAARHVENDAASRHFAAVGTRPDVSLDRRRRTPQSLYAWARNDANAGAAGSVDRRDSGRRARGSRTAGAGRKHPETPTNRPWTPRCTPPRVSPRRTTASARGSARSRQPSARRVASA